MVVNNDIEVNKYCCCSYVADVRISVVSCLSLLYAVLLMNVNIILEYWVGHDTFGLRYVMLGFYNWMFHMVVPPFQVIAVAVVGAWSVSSHSLNQCSVTVYWNLTNKLK